LYLVAQILSPEEQGLLEIPSEKMLCSVWGQREEWRAKIAPYLRRRGSSRASGM
jgi:hypothetical protein